MPETRELNLTNLSEGDNLKYYWNFGDGSISNASDPVHIYDHPGTYRVTLTIKNNDGSCMDRYSATIRAATAVCDADFAVYIDSSNNTVYLRAKQVLKDNRYLWLLGDGSVGNTPNYIHTFSDPGFYTVALGVYNSEIGCVESHKETILVGRQSPVGKADFMFVAGEDNTVAFTNQSLGENLSYIWNFNDGTEPSKEKNPVHTFADPGYYYVCLTVFQADNNRQDTYCEKIFAGTDTKDQCLARFEYALSNNKQDIHCWDRSFGNPDEWKWTYNNGSPDTDPNPWWHTDVPAYVKVHQWIRNSVTECRDDAFALVNMGLEARLKAGFGHVPGDTNNKKADTYPIDFVGISLGDAGKLKWDFGDGTYDSTTINPTHHYSAPGPYTVCLTITNTSTGEEDTDCQDIIVGWAASRKEIGVPDAIMNSYPNPFTESTRIEILLSEDTNIDLSVYDLAGRKIRTIASEQRPAGLHTFSLDGSDLEGGNYYLILETETGREEQIISIIR
jgi:PKD repeat protein